MEQALPRVKASPGFWVDPHRLRSVATLIRLDRPVKSFERWIARIPGVYSESVLEETPKRNTTIDNDVNCIAKLKDYRSLMPMAQEAHKPMFFLKPGDGALGAHTYAVQDAYGDFLEVGSEDRQKDRTAVALDGHATGEDPRDPRLGERSQVLPRGHGLRASVPPCFPLARFSSCRAPRSCTRMGPLRRLNGGPVAISGG